MLALASGLLGNMAGHAATAPSIEDFASRAQVEDVSISPDGRYLAQIRARDGKAMAAVADRHAGAEQIMRPVLSEPDRFGITPTTASRR
jgi:hypothetical protein